MNMWSSSCTGPAQGGNLTSNVPWLSNIKTWEWFDPQYFYLFLYVFTKIFLKGGIEYIYIIYTWSAKTMPNPSSVQPLQVQLSAWKLGRSGAWSPFSAGMPKGDITLEKQQFAGSTWKQIFLCHLPHVPRLQNTYHVHKWYLYMTSYLTHVKCI